MALKRILGSCNLTVAERVEGFYTVDWSRTSPHANLVKEASRDLCRGNYLSLAPFAALCRDPQHVHHLPRVGPAHVEQHGAESLRRQRRGPHWSTTAQNAPCVQLSSNSNGMACISRWTDARRIRNADVSIPFCIGPLKSLAHPCLAFRSCGVLTYTTVIEQPIHWLAQANQ